MDYKTVGFGLGLFSIALGAAELLAPRKLAEALDAPGGDGVVKAFGGREIAAGVALLNAPAVSTNVWNRVLGDAMDLGALGLAARNAPRNPAVWGAIGFVLGVTLVDVLTARGLDGETGKATPARVPLPAHA